MKVMWPKNGVVIVFCKGGRYWANPVCEDLSNAKEVLEDLQKQAAEKQRKELLEACGKQVNRRLAVN